MVWAAATDDNVAIRKMVLITSKRCFRAEQEQKEKRGEKGRREKKKEKKRGGEGRAGGGEENKREGESRTGRGEGRQGLLYQDGIFEGLPLVPRTQGVGSGRVCHPKIRLFGILIILIW